MPESPTFLEEVFSAMPEDSRIVMCSNEFCEEVAVLQAADSSSLYFATNEIWRKLGIISDVFRVGTPEEIAFRATRKEIAELLPKEGAYAVIEQKSADKPSI
jgi:hypothetical protein